MFSKDFNNFLLVHNTTNLKKIILNQAHQVPTLFSRDWVSENKQHMWDVGHTVSVVLDNHCGQAIRYRK